MPWQHLFQGLKFSDVTGLAYVRNRDYSTTLGRFIELDPIGFDAGDNNWYRFVGNGPTGNVDPSGLDQETLIPVPSDPFSGETVEMPAGWPRGFPSPLPVPPPEVYELPFGPIDPPCDAVKSQPSQQPVARRQYRSPLIVDPFDPPPPNTRSEAFKTWAAAKARDFLVQKGSELLMETGYLPTFGIPTPAPCARPAHRAFYRITDINVTRQRDGMYEIHIKAEWYY